MKDRILTLCSSLPVSSVVTVLNSPFELWGILPWGTHALNSFNGTLRCDRYAGIADILLIVKRTPERIVLGTFGKMP